MPEPLTSLRETLPAVLTASEFTIPLWFNLVAVLVLSTTGALAAMRRRYDIVGVFSLALLTGLGGALLRDGIFLQSGPPLLLRDWHYLTVVLLGCVICYFMYDRLRRLSLVFEVLDAVGLAAYALVGTQMALKAGLASPAAVLVGLVNAVGGSVLRDVVTREEPLLFKPGEFYALAAAIGCGLFVILTQVFNAPGAGSALISSGVILVVRLLTIRYNWRTTPLRASPDSR
ncbi:MAG TPA: TRIC cation channel family protein [Verrucomicrobiota bacterium]|nr:TRIC cation channel family protein [Verrucomicrobiota bacterium]